MSGRASPSPRPLLLTLLLAAGVLVGLLLTLGLQLQPAADWIAHADRQLFLVLRGADPATVGPPVFVEVLRDVTAFGSYTAVGIVLGLAVLGLLLTGYRREALFLVLTFAAGALATALLKELIARPRPDIVLGAPHVATLSFPSGHASKAALAYLGLAVVVSALSRQRRIRAFVWTAGVLLTLAIGLSRILLGVHWPTDVVAGWLLGGTFVLAAVLIERRIRVPGRAFWSGATEPGQARDRSE